MTPDFLNLLADIFEVCIIPLLGVLTAYAVKYIKVKSMEITEKADNALVDKYTVMLADTISACVLATNQTYVEALKKQGSFDVEAQKEAFNKTFYAVMGVLTEDAKEYLATLYGDANAYLTARIEAEVNLQK